MKYFLLGKFERFLTDLDSFIFCPPSISAGLSFESVDQVLIFLFLPYTDICFGRTKKRPKHVSMIFVQWIKNHKSNKIWSKSLNSWHGGFVLFSPKLHITGFEKLSAREQSRGSGAGFMWNRVQGERHGVVGRIRARKIWVWIPVLSLKPIGKSLNLCTSVSSGQNGGMRI